MIKNNKEGSFLALLPIVVYLGLSLGIAVLLGSARAVPPLVLMMIAVGGVAFAMNRELSFNEKWIFCGGGVR